MFCKIKEERLEKILTKFYNVLNERVHKKERVMPKIIENLREKLLIEAKKQVMEQGYGAMTIRSVASACGVGIGTVYNYFASKDILIASFMIGDWLECKEAIDVGCKEADEPKSALYCIYKEVNQFRKKYEILFSDKDAKANSMVEIQNRHVMLRSQIAESLYAHCKKQDKADARFLSEFIAEAMLAWMNAGRSFEEISSILLQLF